MFLLVSMNIFIMVSCCRRISSTVSSSLGAFILGSPSLITAPIVAAAEGKGGADVVDIEDEAA